jgi:hypothetical protein
MQQKARVVENPISGKILVVCNPGGTTMDLARIAAAAARQYPDRLIEASMDGGASRMSMSAEERAGKNLTAVDFFEKITAARGGNTESWMFNAAQGQDGTVEATFTDRAKESYVNIFDVAIDAALFSRQFDAPVTFEFRNRKVTVDKSTDPEAIEQLFPGNQRVIRDYEPPPRQWFSVKDQFNVEASADGVTATYKDSRQAGKHIYYIGMDLINLSHEFNDKPVSYVHLRHALTVTSADDEKSIEKRIPEKDRWPQRCGP